MRRRSLIIIVALIVAFGFAAAAGLFGDLSQLRLIDCATRTPYNAAISGTVKDGTTGVGGVLVTLSLHGTTTTASNGNYYLAYSETHFSIQHQVSATKDGYLTGVTAYFSDCPEDVTTDPQVYGNLNIAVSKAPAMTVDFTTTAADLKVTLSGKITGGSSPFRYSFDWGDGVVYGESTTSPGQVNVFAEHTYAAAGTYSVKLAVKDLYNQQASATHTVTVTATSPPLTAVGISIVAQTQLTVTLKADISGGTPPYTASWDFGDAKTGTGTQVTHTYATEKTYTVKLLVTDSKGKTSTALKDIAVSVPAVAAAIEVVSTDKLMVSLAGVATEGTSPYTYAWNFGDGETGTGTPVTHTYPAAATYSIVLTVKDSLGKTAPATRDITVSTTVPDPGGVLTVSFAVDAVGLVVEFAPSVSGGTAPFTYSWDFGDGNTSTSQGPVHEYPKAGTYTVTLKVTDSVSAVEMSTQDVTVKEELPVTFSPVAIVLLFAGVAALAGGLVRRGKFLAAIPVGMVLLIIGLLMMMGILVI